MARSLGQQATDLQRTTADLVKKFQFRDRNETVAYGLSVSQSYALRSLSENGPLAMGELAADMHLTVSTMTRIVGQLVRKQLVRRTFSDADRRVCRVSLTPRGRSLWKRIQTELVADYAEVLRAVPAAERETLIRAIGRLSAGVDTWRARKAVERGR